MRQVRVFVSSPGDGGPERQRVQWVVERLNGEFRERLHIETILWEDEVYNAHDGFQPQIDRKAKPADCDLVLGILWGRLGTALHESFPERQPDGTPYPSGTAYEILSALEARQASGSRPDVYVFRKLAEVQVPVGNAAALEEATNQWKRLQAFSDQYFELADNRILRAVEKFRDIGEFEQKIERLLRGWIRTHAPQEAVWSIEEKGSPFRGLEPFDAKHADVYFGRDRKVQRAIDELQAAARRGKPFLLIPGASGSGKSSLMRAALAPRLTQPGAVPGVDLWRVAVMRPGTDGHPMLALARALFVTGDEKRDDPGGFGQALPELAAGAFKTPERLSELFDTSPNVAVDPVLEALDRIAGFEGERRNFERPLKVDLLLLVDQLEDIFSSAIAVEKRHRFAELLAALVRTGRVWVVATLRADMYQRMITDRPFIVLKDQGGHFDLSPPGPEELDEIIHRSAAAAGLTYETRLPAEGAAAQEPERLDDLLLRDAAGENTLPLLQFTLNLLFEACWGRARSKVLSIAAYREIGGLDGAINQTAESALVQLVRPDASFRFPLEKELDDEVSAAVNTKLESLVRKLVAPVGQDAQGVSGAADRAFTARIVPIGEARRDDLTGRLIDALLHARILHATRSAQGSSLRISHDRVIASWARANVMTERNRDFYRVRDAIDHGLTRWEDSQRSAEFLLPAGAPVTQAEEKISQFPEEFSSAARNFVEVSSRRVRFRQRVTAVAAVVFAIVAVIATGSSWYATKQRTRATQNYEAARGTVGRLVTSITQQLKDLEGIHVSTVEKSLEQVVGLVAGLEVQNRADPELQRIRGSMHFEFAKAFQNMQKLERALDQAQAALGLRETLASAAAPREWVADYAASLDQVGDIRRVMAANLERNRDPKAKPEFEASRTLLDQALAIRTTLYTGDPQNVEWTYNLSQSLVRIGDDKLIGSKRDPAGAQADYERALKLITNVVKRDSQNVVWEREYSWCLNKMGDVLKTKDPAAGLAMYERALCTRRYLSSRDTTNTLWKRDVAFTLERVSDVKAKAGNRAGAEEALFESLQIRRELIKDDPTHMLWLKELGSTLQLVGKLESQQKQMVEAVGFYEMALETRQQLEKNQRRPNTPAAERQAVAKQVTESREARDAAVPLAALGKSPELDKPSNSKQVSRPPAKPALQKREGSNPDIRLVSGEAASGDAIQSARQRAKEFERDISQRLAERPADPAACWKEVMSQLAQMK